MAGGHMSLRLYAPGEPMADWNSALYMKFENERTRAARDLLAQIPEFEPDRIWTSAVVLATAPNC
jgi:hypothetical protein